MINNTWILNAPFLNRERLAADLGNLLVLAPHPDDESLGCGGLIALLKEAGSSVSIIFVTSGSASHTSVTYPSTTLSKIREAEAIRACSELGVPISALRFLRAPDSKLGQLQEKEVDALVREVMEIFGVGNFSSIALPWRRDPHPDHRVVNTIGELAIEKLQANVTKFEYPIWLWKNGTENDWPIEGEAIPYRLQIKPVFQKKWHAVQRHRSQLGKIIFDDPNGFELTDELLEPFKTDTEYFFVTKQAVQTLDSLYFEKLYSRQVDPWNFKNSEYELGKYKRSIKILGHHNFDSGLELGCSVGVQTGLLSEICNQLTAVDISEVAINEAKKNCSGKANIIFKTMDIVKEFPQGKFNLVTCCEIGYYLTREHLEQLFLKISDALLPNGRLLLVHWTRFVPDYPLSGDEVHKSFAAFAKRKGHFSEIVLERKENYVLQVYQKVSDERER
ncbi:N-acetylglucosaminyl deacetylase, LmbE family [Pricia antarctica]|uniref:N-acetylglucosaminyl deacetylase, LmbE family n=1 Tax=Pricia antarctica TaxID=641691 RepID=A0A1G7I6R3_9FLAO|nr:bifunctional PIG-L family deacetylase/class I SAM-dependent methyltransferase [Pricia antarctica]SDF08411.1 N-acetylglucosaminyl deacetylase, LmbE family [Pricia antarctica]